MIGSGRVNYSGWFKGCECDDSLISRRLLKNKLKSSSVDSREPTLDAPQIKTNPVWMLSLHKILNAHNP